MEVIHLTPTADYRASKNIVPQRGNITKAVTGIHNTTCAASYYDIYRCIFLIRATCLHSRHVPVERSIIEEFMQLELLHRINVFGDEFSIFIMSGHVSFKLKSFVKIIILLKKIHAKYIYVNYKKNYSFKIKLFYILFHATLTTASGIDELYAILFALAKVYETNESS